MSLKIHKYLNKDNSQRSELSFFTLKGKDSSSDMVISKDELLGIISRLRGYEDTPVRKLTGSIKEDFKNLVKYINYTHQTNTYGMLKSLIDDQFGDLDSVEPGTVGAYFYGSNMHVNIDPKECGAVTANSIPLTSDHWNTCKNNIILAEEKNHGYDFALLSTGDDKSHAYLYVKHDTYDDFNGFSSDERRALRKYGVEYVYLYGYGSKAGEYKDLVGSAISVNDIKSRSKSNHHSNDNESKSGFGWWWILIIIIIIVIIIAIACSWKDNSKVVVV